MMTCKNCGSYAINEHLHGRVKGQFSNLCDVCYWRKIAQNRLDLLLLGLPVEPSILDEISFKNENQTHPCPKIVQFECVP